MIILDVMCFPPKTLRDNVEKTWCDTAALKAFETLKQRRNAWHFHIYFLCGKSCTLTKFSEICFQGSKVLQNSIGSDNGSVPYRRQAIIGSIDGLIYQHTYASLASVGSANSEHVRQPIPGRIQWFRFFILYILMILKLHWKKWSFS